MRRVTLKGALTYTILLSWSAVCLLPLYWVLLASLKSEDAIIHGPRYMPFVDFAPTLDAWRFILLDSHDNLLWPFFNSSVVACLGTLIATTLSCFMLYGLTRFPSPYNNNIHLLLWGTLASRILSPACMVIPLYLMAKVTGLLDTHLALIITYATINVPVALWLLLPVFGTKQSEQEEAATLEGAGHLYVLTDIVWPTLRPAIASVAMIIFILCWNEYLFAAYLTTDQASTLTPWMVGQLSLKEAQIGSEADELAHLSAATVFMVMPLLLVAGIVQRAMTRAISAK